MVGFDSSWYGRAGVWMGTTLLLLMAVTGRQEAVLSILSVLGITVGLVLLVYPILLGPEHPNEEPSGPAGGRMSQAVTRVPRGDSAGEAQANKGIEGENALG